MKSLLPRAIRSDAVHASERHPRDFKRPVKTSQDQWRPVKISKDYATLELCESDSTTDDLCSSSSSKVRKSAWIIQIQILIVPALTSSLRLMLLELIWSFINTQLLPSCDCSSLLLSWESLLLCVDLFNEPVLCQTLLTTTLTSL